MMQGVGSIHTTRFIPNRCFMPQSQPASETEYSGNLKNICTTNIRANEQSNERGRSERGKSSTAASTSRVVQTADKEEKSWCALEVKKQQQQ
jgi:hypothetical protein